MGRRLRVDKREYHLPNGTHVEKVAVHPGNAVAILPFCADGACYLIRQYRFVIGDYILEVPAGTLNPGEGPLDAARRELIEETGFQAETFIPRGSIYTTPGFSDEIIHLYEAHGLTPSCLYQKDEDEIIELVRVEREDLPDMIGDGRICDAKTISIICRCIGASR
ncbi:MAG: adenosine nucleotide hydrolase NudE [Methanoregulaceae archaeon PtaU1.Bin222]|nr:MAG: adenosine nucleotide hydrolase NudE [Methanoregulaceae archaeon PtaU1.Bin222]